MKILFFIFILISFKSYSKGSLDKLVLVSEYEKYQTKLQRSVTFIKETTKRIVNNYDYVNKKNNKFKLGVFLLNDDETFSYEYKVLAKLYKKHNHPLYKQAKLSKKSNKSLHSISYFLNGNEIHKSSIHYKTIKLFLRSLMEEEKATCSDGIEGEYKKNYIIYKNCKGETKNLKVDSCVNKIDSRVCQISPYGIVVIQK